MAWEMCTLVVFLFSNLLCQERVGVAHASALPWVSQTGVTEGLHMDELQLITDQDEERLLEDEPLQNKEGREITDDMTKGLRRMPRDTATEVTGETTSWDISSLWTKNSVIGTATESSLRDEPREHTAKDRTNYSCETYNLFALFVVPVVLSIGGLIGNTLCALVFWAERQKSSSSVLLLQQAIVDSLVLITWSINLLAWLAQYYGKDSPYWLYTASVYMRKYGSALCNVVHMVPVWLMVSITALRYVAVCHPLKMRVLSSVKVAWIQFGILVVVSWIFSVPKFFEVDIVTLEDGRIKAVNTLL